MTETDHNNAQQGNRLEMWITGILFASVPAVYGIHCLLSGQTTIIGRGGRTASVTGFSAIAFAITCISIGCWMHFRYFWGNHPALVPYSEMGKLGSIGVFGCSLVVGAVSVLAFG